MITFAVISKNADSVQLIDALEAGTDQLLQLVMSKPVGCKKLNLKALVESKERDQVIGKS